MSKLYSRSKYLVLGWLLAVAPAWGQGAADACGSGRYAADVFATVSQTSGVTYGTNSVRDYSSGTDTPVTLQLDFYEPAGDAAARRPLLIFAFGGSFVSGQRQDMDDLCRAFARKGYATATIDYRLVPAGPNGYNYALVFGSRARLADQLVRASSDLKAAVRFFRHDAATANTYRIDPARIFVAGYSAGAITALLTAYINQVDEDSNLTAAFQANGGLEGNTDLPAPNSLLPAYNAANPAGALSLAGAVPRLSVVKATDPPLYAAHGDADTTVPYNSGPAFGGSAYTLYGGGALHARADSVGLRNQLYTIAGGDHGSPRQEPNRLAITTAAAQFFQGILCASPLPVQLVSFGGQLAAGTCAPTLTWRTASELNSRAFEVQQSADGQAFATVGTVPARNSAAGGSYSLTLAPLRGPAYFRLRLIDQDQSFSYGPALALAGECGPGLAAVPNPAGEQVQLRGLPAGSCQLRLRDATGRLLRQATATEGTTFDLSGLPAGLYLLQVSTQAGLPAGQLRLLKQ